MYEIVTVVDDEELYSEISFSYSDARKLADQYTFPGSVSRVWLRYSSICLYKGK